MHHSKADQTESLLSGAIGRGILYIKRQESEDIIEKKIHARILVIKVSCRHSLLVEHENTQTDFCTGLEFVMNENHTCITTPQHTPIMCYTSRSCRCSHFDKYSKKKNTWFYVCKFLQLYFFSSRIASLAQGVGHPYPFCWLGGWSCVKSMIYTQQMHPLNVCTNFDYIK